MTTQVKQDLQHLRSHRFTRLAVAAGLAVAPLPHDLAAIQTHLELHMAGAAVQAVQEVLQQALAAA